MPCVHPYVIPNPRLKNIYSAPSPVQSLAGDPVRDLLVENIPRYIVVDCGKCYECKRKARNQIAVRLCHELDFGKHKNATFVTLTISPEHYDHNQEPRWYLNRFFDRLRKAYGYIPKHFIVSELGEDPDGTKRLHFHGIIFDLPFFDRRFKIMNPKLREVWQYGITWCGWCNKKTCFYIVKYILKQDSDDYQHVKRFSPKLGANFALKNEKNIRDFVQRGECPTVVINQRTYGLPRYYRKVIFSDLESLFNSIRQYEIALSKPPESPIPIHERRRYSTYDAYLASRRYLEEIACDLHIQQDVPKVRYHRTGRDLVPDSFNQLN